MKVIISTLASLLLAICTLAAPEAASGQQLISNGNFEAGLAGWNINNLAGSSGDWFLDAPGTTTPLSGNTTGTNGIGGTFYAVTDQTGPGTHSLRQTFTVPAGAVSVALS